VIVLLYDGEKWIHPCVRSLEEQTLSRKMYEIILVDNGGTTPSAAAYEGRDNLRVIRFPQNYGFTGGNNRALAQAGGEIIFLMNQDAVAHADCLKELVTAADSYPEAGILSASMHMVSAEDGIRRHEPLGHTTGLYQLHRLGYASYEVVRTDSHVVPVDFASGNGLGFRREILEDIGGRLFDERLGSYAEDLDLSIRMKRTKWKMVVCPRAVIYHHRDEAFTGKPSDMLRKFLHISANRLLVYYWNLKTIDFLKRGPALLLGIPFKAARPDGAKRLNLSRLFVSFLIMPAAVALFITRLRKISPEND
jgi:GT2 family glycosyltransferase